MKRTLSFMLVICFMLTSALTFAQQKKITGKIVGDDGLGVPATVQIKGTTKGAAADIDGNYSIQASKGQTLIYSSIGYATKEVIVGNENVINLTLQSEATKIDEAVVTAMGIKREKKALGYAVQDIKADELMKNKSTNVINSLGGKIAGVSVNQGGGAAGGGSNIIIRGGTSLERDNQPLFVVDGVIYDNQTVIAGNSGFDGAIRGATTNANRVMDINPEDVESMSVLKGPAAAALYGSRAAAGAIIITTKKGKEGHVEIGVNSKFTYSKINRFPEQQGKYKRGYYQSLDGVLNDYTTQSWGEEFQAGEKMYNNIEDFFRGGVTWDNNVSVAGGNKNGSFYLSASRYDQNGIVPTTGYNKTTFRFNGDQKYGILTVGANVAYSIASTDKTLTSAGLFNSGGTGAMVSTYRWARSDNMKHYLNDDGTKYRMFAGLQELEDDVENPYWILNKYSLRDKTERFTGNINAKLDLFDWWDISYRAGYDTYTTRDRNFISPGSALRITYQNGKLSENDYKYEYLSSNVMTNFHKTFFDDFNFNLMLGNTIEDTKTNTERRNGWNFNIDGIYSFENILQENKRFQSLHSRSRLIGLFGEFRVDYKNMAYLTFSGRNDWNSTLPIDNRSYFYPAISGSFVFTELLPKNDILTFGKIRASWARVGKGTNPYELETTTWPALSFLNGISAVGNSWQRGNPYLKPEITESWEIGTELRFLNNRASIDFAYYSNNSRNQICTPRLSNASGYILVSTNVGNVTNKGWEISLSGTPIKTKDFTWETQLNLAANRGKVKNLMTGQEMLYVTDAQFGTVKATSFNNGIFMGLSGSIWERDPDGNTVVDASTGIPVSTTPTYSIGNREPKLTGGFNNTLNYKNWSLNILLDFRIGGDIYNGTEYMMTVAGMSKKTEYRDFVAIDGVVKSGTADNPVYTPKTVLYERGKMYNVGGTTMSGSSLIQQFWQSYANNSENFLTKTNWLRLRSISLTYTFDEKILKKIPFIKGLSATASVNNILLLTNYHGLDPETSVAGSGVVGSGSMGIDYCGVPATSSFSLGINLKF